MKTLTIILITLFCFSSVNGQENRYTKVFDNVFSVTNKKGFRGQHLKGKRNGMGLLKIKNFTYVGDFYRDEITGYGMLIATSKKVFIEHCKGCVAYVGNWKDGKKSGMGTCYNNEGNVIYQGLFSDDKPTNEYPSHSVDISKHFMLLEMGNDCYYIGEAKGENANGYGMIVFGSNEVWLSSFQHGDGKGIGLYMYANGEWETFNYRDGNYQIVSSSENYKNLDAIRKQNIHAVMNEALQGISASLEELSSLLANKDEVDIDTDEASSSSSYTGTGGGEGGISNSRGAKVNHANWHSLENSYSNYESQLDKMKSNGVYNKQEVREIQRKMKEIRGKIDKQSGRTRSVSPLENWNP